MAEQPQESNFTKAIAYLFGALFFFTPLILWPKTSEVFEFNKMLFVYVVTILIVACWIGKSASEKKLIIRRTPLDIPILLFLLSQILSTIFSIDTHTSLWGYYSRFHGGLMSTIAYVALYYAFVSNISAAHIDSILYSLVSSAALVSIYGILEHFGIDKNLWIQDVQNRVFSTLGQPNWLSAYLLALLPLPILLAFKNWRRRNSFLTWLALAFLIFITIIFTKSQSGISATFLILGLIGVYLLSQKTKLVIPAALILVAALAIFKWSFVEKISPLGPPNLSALVKQDNETRFGGSDSMIIRQVVWQGARELGKRYPLFGTGVETFGYTYYWVRPPLHNLLSEWEFLYNKAHNEYLNLLANTGFVGLGAYLLLIGWTLVWWIRSLSSNPEKTVSLSLFFGYLSILVTNYFGFSVVTVALFFFLFPAISETLSNPKAKYLSLNFPINKGLAFFILVPAAYWAIQTPLAQFRADLAYNRGKSYLAQNILKASLDELAKAKKLEPNEPLFQITLAEAQATSAVSVRRQLDQLTASDSGQLRQSGETILTSLMNDAEANAAAAVSKNPYQTNYFKTKAKTELYLGLIDPSYDKKALQTLLDLSQIAPTDAKVAYNIGLLYQAEGEKDKALTYFRHSLELKPDYESAQAALNQK